ncbi:MAG: FAD binding domain-containing protein [Fidelibacterota bacterium]|nr:MAG: FAD binding domain-containing protein [Candidatus Neomarinimicrobiota bacterium]
MKYSRPETLSQYFDSWSTWNASKVALLAGGTDLIPKYEKGHALPEHLIDIKAIPELQGIVDGENSIEIGSMTTIESLKRSAMIRRYFPALAMAADSFAGAQIRNRATLGGNIANASPAGDTLTPLYAYDTMVRITGRDSDRTVPLSDIVRGPGEVNLRPGQLLQTVILPKSGRSSFFYKLGLRRAMAIAVVNFAVVYSIADHHYTDLVITAGAVAPRVVYLSSLTGAILDDGLPRREYMALVDADISPIDDIRASAEYRRMALKNLVDHYLRHLLERGHGR